MPSVIDPQNPVHFVANVLIPTELDKSKVSYGLAQEVADGPSTQVVGRIVRPPASGVQVLGPVASVSGARSVGGLVSPASGVQQTGALATSSGGAQNLGGIQYVSPGVQQLGIYIYHSEAGARPEVPA